MRYILATTLIMAAGYIAPASAVGPSCGPAIQNWTNGSQTTCTYDSNGATVEPASAAPAPVVPVVEEENCREEGKQEARGAKGPKGVRGPRVRRGET